MIDIFRNVSEVLRFIKNDPRRVDDFADSLSNTQYQSKKWLIDTLVQLQINPQRVLILGGWYGSYTIPLLNKSFAPKYILLSDKDPNVLSVAEYLHDCVYQTNSNVRTAVIDVEKDTDILETMDYDLVINTSCEHMFNLDKIKTSSKQTVYAFQSCDKGTDPGHVNPASSTQQLVGQAGINKILYAGRYDLGHKSRFMVIGQRH
jgi:hypothetical protein